MADRALNLIEDRVDLAVRIGPLPDSRLVASKVGQIRRVVCAGPTYLKERGTPRNPPELLKHDCVTFTGLTDAGSWVFRDHEIVRVQIAAAVKAGQLSVVLRKFEPEPLPVSLIYIRESRITAKLRAFIDYAAPRLRARLTGAGI